MNNYNEKLNHLTNNFDISDTENSDSDSDNQENYNLKSNLEILDKLDLRYYPEPFNTLGQFLMSVIVGTITAYIFNMRANKIFVLEKSLEAYFDYCKNVKSDNYINELTTNLKLDTSNTENIIKLNIILEKLKSLSFEIINNLLISNEKKYTRYIELSNTDFNIETVNADMLIDLKQLINLSILIDLI
jgi:hypothetical protein